MTGIEEFMTVVDRVVGPITERMGRMETKLDAALALHESIAVQNAAQLRTDIRLESLESQATKTTVALAKAEGRNAIINWILGLIGAPVVVGLAVAGIAKLAGWV